MRVSSLAPSPNGSHPDCFVCRKVRLCTIIKPAVATSPIADLLLSTLSVTRSMQSFAGDGRVRAPASLQRPRCCALRQPHSSSATFRQHALHQQLGRWITRNVAAFSVSATIADRPRIDAPPTISTGRGDDSLLDCVVVGGGISGLVTAQVGCHCNTVSALPRLLLMVMHFGGRRCCA